MDLTRSRDDAAGRPGAEESVTALFMWGLAPPLWQVALLALLGGLLGIAAMVPLRRLLIVRAADELPYPEEPPARRSCARPPPRPPADAGSSSASPSARP
jgi:OPT oligopeptide transporter protein